MKKKEAEVLAPEKIDVIVEYIMQILEDTSKVSGMMNFSSAKHLNLGITSDHYNVLCKEFLDRVLTTFLPHETIGATRFYQFRSNNIFDGVNIVNSIGSEIKVNMYGIDKNISNEYNEKYEEYLNQSMMENNASRKRV